MKSYVSIIAIVLIFFGCKSKKTIQSSDYRPQYHYTPEKNWVNDPNGLVYLDGEYHLFYQYNPFGEKWGHMSWGHAVSKDLKKWESLPVALPEIDNGNGTTTMIFSGSIVIDSANTSGFFEKDQKNGMVAIFTSHVDSSGTGIAQHQSLAYSKDKGRTWKYYDKNPVLDIGLKDFRDPNVIWNKKRNSWLMSVVVPLEFKVQFYESTNLKNWSLLSEFGKMGDTTKIWECPSLVELPIENSDEKKWALFISSGHLSPGFVGMQYFVGDFDGKTFTPLPQEGILQVDAGKDFYAAIPFNNLPSSQPKPITMGWTNNWAYAGDIPTAGFRGGFSFPRAISLYKSGNGLRLKSEPIVPDEIPTIQLSKKNPVYKYDAPTFHLSLSDVSDNMSLVLEQSSESKTIISYKSGVLSFDRSKSGNVEFNSSFPSVEQLNLKDIKNLNIYVDNSIIEVFANNGEYVMTQQIFPLGPKGSVSLSY